MATSSAQEPTRDEGLREKTTKLAGECGRRSPETERARRACRLSRVRWPDILGGPDLDPIFYTPAAHAYIISVS